mgnify:CR=1 FL=1
MMRGALLALLVVLQAALVGAAYAAHAYAQFGDIKYPPGFFSFEWANANAPKRGDIALVAPTRLTNFDKFNPFTLKGAAAPGLNSLVFETLMTGTYDEPNTAYGLLEEDIEVAEDLLSVTFRINAKAKFQDGTPVTAEDVKFSFERYRGNSQALLKERVARVSTPDARTVEFRLAEPWPEVTKPSTDASSTTANSERGLASVRFSRNRRKMFSTSMMASSTTTPMATARPPSVIVFNVTPSRSSAITAASSESGMAVKEISAVRQSSRNRNKITPTNAAPSSSDLLMLWIACSMNVAGRCRCGTYFTPAASRLGRNSSSATSTSSVASIVFAPY